MYFIACHSDELEGTRAGAGKFVVTTIVLCFISARATHQVITINYRISAIAGLSQKQPLLLLVTLLIRAVLDWCQAYQRVRGQRQHSWLPCFARLVNLSARLRPGRFV